MGFSRKMEGIVIRRANVGEADRIVTLFTPEGKLAAIAKGVRKLSSRKAGALELFTAGRFILADTKGLPIIQEVEIFQVFPALREHFSEVAHAYWAAELIDRLVGEGEEHRELYYEFLAYLNRLGHTHHPLDVHTFELVAMRTLGWQPELHQCAHCHESLRGERFAWSDQLGGVIDQSCANGGITRPMSIEAIKVLRLLVEQGFDVSHRLNIEPKLAGELEAILHGYLESLSERPWQSPQLLRL